MTAQAPDVSVIVPVFNTMPYLTACLDSLIEQTIGLDRLEVISVDDGSTDGSGEELERFARLYPDVVTVLHQKNSGGPAAPCNRGIERARGRFLYFIGADDYLGAEAMQRLVSAADEWGSDVAFGRAVGINGRFVWQPIFKTTDHDLDLYDSLLPFAVSNSKLFRRSLVEDHGLRYPEDLSMGSDQPFTIEALVRSNRISVLADYTYLYGVRRHDASNISYSARLHDRLSCTTRIMDFVAGLLQPGPQRDAILTRHFAWELSKLLGAEFLALPDREQRRLCDRLRWLCESYLTERIHRALSVRSRLRLDLARDGDLDGLRGVISYLVEHGAPPLAIDGSEVFLGFPGYGAGQRPVPDMLVPTSERAIGARLANGLDIRRVRWWGQRLVVDGHLNLAVVGGDVDLRLALRPGRQPRGGARSRSFAAGDAPDAVEWRASTEDQAPGVGLVFRAVLDPRDLPEPNGPRGIWSMTLRMDVAGRTYDIPVPSTTAGRPVVLRRRGRFYRLAVRSSAEGTLALVSRRIPWRKALRTKLRQRRRARRRRR